MKLYSLVFLRRACGASCSVPDPRVPDSQATLDYIHTAWDSLTRSATDCSSLADVKVAAASVSICPLSSRHLPPLTHSSRSAMCKVMHLPRPIVKLADVRPEELPAPGLLYLPNPYVVPGGRFNEMYGWDSYFILLGLEADHREALAKGHGRQFSL